MSVKQCLLSCQKEKFEFALLQLRRLNGVSYDVTFKYHSSIKMKIEANETYREMYLHTYSTFLLIIS